MSNIPSSPHFPPSDTPLESFSRKETPPQSPKASPQLSNLRGHTWVLAGNEKRLLPLKKRILFIFEQNTCIADKSLCENEKISDLLGNAQKIKDSTLDEETVLGACRAADIITKNGSKHSDLALFKDIDDIQVLDLDNSNPQLIKALAAEEKALKRGDKTAMARIEMVSIATGNDSDKEKISKLMGIVKNNPKAAGYTSHMEDVKESIKNDHPSVVRFLDECKNRAAALQKNYKNTISELETISSELKAPLLTRGIIDTLKNTKLSPSQKLQDITDSLASDPKTISHIQHMPGIIKAVGKDSPIGRVLQAFSEKGEGACSEAKLFSLIKTEKSTPEQLKSIVELIKTNPKSIPSQGDLSLILEDPEIDSSVKILVKFSSDESEALQKGDKEAIDFIETVISNTIGEMGAQTVLKSMKDRAPWNPAQLSNSLNELLKTPPGSMHSYLIEEAIKTTDKAFKNDAFMRGISAENIHILSELVTEINTTMKSYATSNPSVSEGLQKLSSSIEEGIKKITDMWEELSPQKDPKLDLPKEKQLNISSKKSMDFLQENLRTTNEHLTRLQEASNEIEARKKSIEKYSISGSDEYNKAIRRLNDIKGDIEYLQGVYGDQKVDLDKAIADKEEYLKKQIEEQQAPQTLDHKIKRRASKTFEDAQKAASIVNRTSETIVRNMSLGFASVGNALIKGDFSEAAASFIKFMKTDPKEWLRSGPPKLTEKLDMTLSALKKEAAIDVAHKDDWEEVIKAFSEESEKISSSGLSKQVDSLFKDITHTAIPGAEKANQLRETFRKTIALLQNEINTVKNHALKSFLQKEINTLDAAFVRFEKVAIERSLKSFNDSFEKIMKSPINHEKFPSVIHEITAKKQEFEALKNEALKRSNFDLSSIYGEQANELSRKEQAITKKYVDEYIDMISPHAEKIMNTEQTSLIPLLKAITSRFEKLEENLGPASSAFKDFKEGVSQFLEEIIGKITIRKSIPIEKSIENLNEDFSQAPRIEKEAKSLIDDLKNMKEMPINQSSKDLLNGVIRNLEKNVTLIKPFLSDRVEKNSVKRMRDSLGFSKANSLCERMSSSIRKTGSTAPIKEKIDSLKEDLIRELNACKIQLSPQSTITNKESVKARQKQAEYTLSQLAKIEDKWNEIQGRIDSYKDTGIQGISAKDAGKSLQKLLREANSLSQEKLNASANYIGSYSEEKVRAALAGEDVQGPFISSSDVSRRANELIEDYNDSISLRNKMAKKLNIRGSEAYGPEARVLAEEGIRILDEKLERTLKLVQSQALNNPFIQEVSNSLTKSFNKRVAVRDF